MYPTFRSHRARRNTEVPWLIGDVVAYGNERGLALPLCERMVVMIVDIEEGRRVQAQANLDELRTLLVST